MKKRITTRIFMTLLLLVLVASVFVLPVSAATCATNKVNLYQKEINVTGAASTNYYINYSASTPEIVSFVDSKGAYNVAYPSNGMLYIHRYSKTLSLQSTLKIPSRLPLFGNVTFDANGNYYVCWGANDEAASNAQVICVSKYDYQGTLLDECRFTGFETSPYSPGDYWGTQYPFDAGTCAMAVNNGILACNFARKMYSGHQSNYAFYIACDTMEGTYGSDPYCSHSFDQDCVATSDGGFLMANQGDAYTRGFVISKISPTNRSENSALTFHFREGSNRPYGYNETYAQLGGVEETSNAYVLCASSERTLSLAVAPTNGYYCSYSEARDLFVQILKKDFPSYRNENLFRVPGETRTATGYRPQSAETELWLSEGITDYGVIWLTNYSDDYFVANPKIVAIEDGQLVLLWEKRHSSDYQRFNPSESPVATYYMIMRDDGSILKAATNIGEINLPSDADVVYNNGSILWTTSAGGTTATINVLDIEGHNYTRTVIKNSTCAQEGVAAYKCSKCAKVWEPRGQETLTLAEHKYGAYVVKQKATFSQNGSVQWTCTACNKVVNGTTRQVKSVQLSAASFAYDGKVKTPGVTVKDAAGKVLKKGTDYTVSYASGRTNIGTYKVVITMKGKYSGSKTLSFQIVPATPAVTAVGTASGNKITWNKIPGAKNYNVCARFYKNGAWTAWSKLGTTTATSYTHTKAASGYYYQYTVLAYNGTLKSGFKASGTTVRLTQPVVTAKGTTAGNKITWNKITGAKTYNVCARFYKNGAWSAWSKLGTTTATSYTHNKAATGYYYQYTVIACNGASKSGFKPSGTAVRLAQPVVTAKGTTAGNQLIWNKITGAKNYDVYCRFYKNGAWSAWSKLGSTTATAYTHNKAATGYYYRYAVIACSGTSKSALKESGTAVRLAQPRVTTVKDGAALQSAWTESVGAKGYHIYRQQYNPTTKKWSSWTKLASVSTQHYVDKTAKAGVFYRYTVAAYSGTSISSCAPGNSVKR